MCCKYSWKTAGDYERFSEECTCYKWFRRTCGLCILVVVVAAACSIYCTFILYAIRDLSNSCKNSQQNTHRNAEKNVQQDNTNHQKDIKTQVYNKNEDTIDIQIYNKTARFKRAKEKKKCKCPKMLAGHYEQKIEYFTDIPEYKDSTMIKTCKYIDKWNGTLCKAGDFKSETKTLQVFQPAAYLKKKSSPFKGIANGKFITKKKGMYLVYAQVSFYDSKEFQQMKVIHRKKGSNEIAQEYACVRSVYNVNKSLNNTCSITALYFLDKGDYLTVDLFDTDLTLNFSSKNTYFGAILLR